MAKRGRKKKKNSKSLVGELSKAIGAIKRAKTQIKRK